MSAPVDAVAPSAAPDRQVDIVALCGVVAVGVVALAVGVFVARVQEAIGITLAAGCLALLTLPVQQWMERRVGHVASMVATAIGSLVAAVTAGYVILRDLGHQAETVAELVRGRLDEVQSGSLADQVVSALALDSAIDEWLRRIPSIVIVGDDGGTGVGRQLVTLLLVVILAAFFQSSGRTIVAWLVARWPRDAVAADGTAPDPSAESPRVAIRSLLLDMERRGVGYVRRTIVLAVLATVAVAVACALLRLPGALALGVWSGVWFVVPTLGGVVGLLPVVMLLALDPRPGTWLALAACVGIAAATRIGRRRLIEGETMRLGVGPYVMSVGLGVGIGGVAGSLVMLLIGAMLCAQLTSVHQAGRPTGWNVDDRHARTVGGIVVPTGWRFLVLAMVMAGVGVLVWAVIHRAAPAFVWLLVGGFVAIAISRPVGWLERRCRLSHHMAAAVVMATVGMALVIVTVSGLDDGARATTTVTEQLPEVVSQLEDTRIIGGWLQDRNASVWMADQVNDLPQRLDKAQPEEWLPTVGARLVDMFWIVLFSIALLVDGRRMVEAALRLIPARHRRQSTRMSHAIGTALAGYVAGSALVAGINASVVFTIAVVLGIGLAPILATWAFLWNFVPQIGGFMGGLPLVLFALVAGPLRGLVAGLLYITYQFIENHLIQPAVIGAAIDVAPWGTLIAALVGGAAAGVIGAVVLTPLVGVIRVVRTEMARDDFPGATVRVEPAAPG